MATLRIATAGVVMALLLAAADGADHPAGDAIPTIHPNDNRLPAGRLEDGTLSLDLEVIEGRWYPESVDGPSIVVAAIAEIGKAPEIPAPLIRIREGTTISVRLRNTLDTALISTEPTSS